MLYLFENLATGEQVELPYSMADVPELGSVVEVDGVAYKRLVSRLQAQIEPTYGFVSKSLPFHWPFARRHNERGEPVFDSLREVRESVARAKAAGEPLHWDP